jgi:hypothetical protein
LRALVSFGFASFTLGCADLASIEEKVLIEEKVPIEEPSSARPPGPPGPSPETFSSMEVWFAARNIWFGMSHRGTKERDLEGWRKIGWDLDGLSTSYEQAVSGKTGHCFSYGSPDAIQDGDDGRDNAIGASGFRDLGGFDPNAEYDMNNGIGNGASTLLLRLEGVNDWQNDESVRGTLYFSTHDLKTGPVPKWDGSDERRVSAFSFAPGSNVPFAKLPNGYIRDGVWVSGEQHVSQVTFSMPIYPQGQTPAILMQARGRHGWLTARLSDGAGGPGTMGFASTKQEVLDTIIPGIAAVIAAGCDSNGAAENVADQYAEHTDLSSFEPWKPNPDVECDSLSWAFDLDWRPIKFGIVEKPVIEEIRDCFE